jgi:hypothetical protein
MSVSREDFPSRHRADHTDRPRAINDHILSLKRPDGTTMSTVQFRSKLQLDQDDECVQRMSPVTAAS